MPYHLTESKDRVCVVRKAFGGRPAKVMHCYPKSEKDKALAYLRALEANVPDARGSGK